MKKVFFFLLLLPAMALLAQDIQKLDTDYGYDVYKFGTPIASFKNMLFVSGTGEVKVFQNRDEKLQLENFTASKITYEFYKSKFYKYTVEAKGIPNRKNMLPWFQAKYGKGQFGGTTANKYAWVGTKVVAHYHETPTGAILEVSSKEIETRIDTDKDKQGD